MDLRDMLRAIRAHAWVIVAAVVLTTLVAAVVSFAGPKTYQASATVLAGQKDTSGLVDLGLQPDRAVQTQVKLMTLRSLAQTVANDLQSSATADDILRRVSVAQSDQTDVIDITAADSTGQGAAAIANSMAKAYVAWSKQVRTAALKAAGDEVQAQMTDAQDQMTSLSRQISKGGAAALAKTSELAAARDRYTALAKRLDDLRVSERLETGDAQVVAEATAPSQPVSPNPVRNIGLGLALGLVVGLGLAYVLGLSSTSGSRDDQTR